MILYGEAVDAFSVWLAGELEEGKRLRGLFVLSLNDKEIKQTALGGGSNLSDYGNKAGALFMCLLLNKCENLFTSGLLIHGEYFLQNASSQLVKNITSAKGGGNRLVNVLESLLHMWSHVAEENQAAELALWWAYRLWCLAGRLFLESIEEGRSIRDAALTLGRTPIQNRHVFDSLHILGYETGGLAIWNDLCDVDPPLSREIFKIISEEPGALDSNEGWALIQTAADKVSDKRDEDMSWGRSKRSVIASLRFLIKTARDVKAHTGASRASRWNRNHNLDELLMGLLEDGIVRDKTILKIEKKHCDDENNKNKFFSSASFDIRSLLNIRKGLKTAANQENRPEGYQALYYSPQQKGTKRFHSPPYRGRFVWDTEWAHWIPQSPRHNPPPKPRQRIR